MSELDRQSGLSIGESRRFLNRERTITHPKMEKYLAALGLEIVDPSAGQGRRNKH